MTQNAGRSLGGQRRAEVLTAGERADIARAGARATNSPAGRARSIVRALRELPTAERKRVRAEVLDILREGGVIQ